MLKKSSSSNYHVYTTTELESPPQWQPNLLYPIAQTGWCRVLFFKISFFCINVFPIIYLSRLLQHPRPRCGMEFNSYSVTIWQLKK